MSTKILKIHPADNVLVALTDLRAGEQIAYNGASATLVEAIPAKHKFVLHPLEAGAEITMYGVLVGKTTRPISAGASVNTHNVKHTASAFSSKKEKQQWKSPDVSRWKDKTFLGFVRDDGRVGTANYWVVVPMVFCENRNVNAIRHAFDVTYAGAEANVAASLVHFGIPALHVTRFPENDLGEAATQALRLHR